MAVRSNGMALDTLGAALVRKLPWMHLLAGATNQDEAEGDRRAHGCHS